jgi:glucose-1-phosphate thymidylyltransferase
MKAIVLAAGFSTRLYPLTKYFPKGLLPIKDKALAGYVLDELVNSSQIDEIAFVTNHLFYPLFEVWLKAYYPKKKITLLDNGVSNLEHRLGAIGDLKFVLEKMRWEDDLLVLSSDTLTSMNFPKFLEFFSKNNGFINAVFDTHDKEIIRKKLGCAILEGDKIIKFVEKPEAPASTLTSIPFYIYPKKSLSLINQYLQQGGASDAPGSIISWLIGKMPVFGYKVQGYYYDVGTVEVYNKLASGIV